MQGRGRGGAVEELLYQSEGATGWRCGCVSATPSLFPDISIVARASVSSDAEWEGAMALFITGGTLPTARRARPYTT
ncbi:unnamed protein product [Arctogadus glacialis]